MFWFENILIVAGISLDIFASMEIQGAMLQKIERKKLIVVSLLVMLLQCVFFYGGYFSCKALAKHEVFRNTEWIGYVIATLIFGLLGVRLVVKAIRREFIDECRKEITVAQYTKIIAQTTVFTLFAGAACGFVGTNVWMMLALIVIFSIIVVALGLYSGYQFGFQMKTVIYIIGAVILWFSGAEILVHHVLV